MGWIGAVFGAMAIGVFSVLGIWILGETQSRVPASEAANVSTVYQNAYFAMDLFGLAFLAASGIAILLGAAVLFKLAGKRRRRFGR